MSKLITKIKQGSTGEAVPIGVLKKNIIGSFVAGDVGAYTKTETDTLLDNKLNYLPMLNLGLTNTSLSVTDYTSADVTVTVISTDGEGNIKFGYNNDEELELGAVLFSTADDKFESPKAFILTLSEDTTDTSYNTVVSCYVHEAEKLTVGTSYAAYYGSVAIKDNAVAVGNCTSAVNTAAFSEGYYTWSAGIASHAEGGVSHAEGNYSHSSGEGTYALGKGAFSMGHSNNNSRSFKVSEDTTIAITEGVAFTLPVSLATKNLKTILVGSYLIILEYPVAILTSKSSTVLTFEATTNLILILDKTKYLYLECLNLALGDYSVTQGCNTHANGENSHAEGYQSVADGDYSHAESSSTASGIGSHAEGSGKAVGSLSHAEGLSTASGLSSHSEGASSTAVGQYSHAEGGNDIIEITAVTSSTSATFEEEEDEIGNTIYMPVDITFTGDELYPVVGSLLSLTKDLSAVVGYVLGYSEGEWGANEMTLTIAPFKSTTINSDQTYYLIDPSSVAYGMCSHSEGMYTVAIGDATHAENEGVAIGNYSHAEGYGTSIGEVSHAEGSGSAMGEYSHAEGLLTSTQFDGEHAEGKYNISTEDSTYGNTLHSIGNGNEDENKNAFEVTELGNGFILNHLYIGEKNLSTTYRIDFIKTILTKATSKTLTNTVGATIYDAFTNNVVLTLTAGTPLLFEVIVYFNGTNPAVLTGFDTVNKPSTFTDSAKYMIKILDNVATYFKFD